MHYSKILNHRLMRGRIWILTKSLRMVNLLYPKAIGEICLLKGMRCVLNHQILRRINLRIRKVYMYKISRLKWIVGVIFHKLWPPPHLGKGGDSLARPKNNKGLRIQRNEHGWIPHRYFQETVDSSNHKEWINATRDEMDLIVRKKVWKLVEIPPQCNSIENKWIFKIKNVRQMDWLISSRFA